MSVLARSMLVWMTAATAAVLVAFSVLASSAPGWLPAICVFLACAGVVAMHGWSIRRTARRLEQQEDAQRLRALSEDSLPLEVRPLIRAINRRLARLDSLGERQSFFLSAAAHEMRTPLTVVRTRLEQLDDSSLKDQLVTDVRRLTRLVNDLLTLMSIRGREPVMRPVDLVERGRRVLDALDTVAAARAVKLRLEAAHGQPSIEGDAGLMDVAITNLVQNAIAHSPLGGIVTISIECGSRITVVDQGNGIPEAKLETLFDPFVRLSNEPGGYGLGLTIVRAIADVHGASIRAGNVFGGGGEFVLSLK